MIVLDTSVLSLAFRRKHADEASSPEALELVDLIEEDAPLVVLGVVFQEVLSGVRNARDFRRLERALEGFALKLADREAHRQAAHISNTCREHGVTTFAVDCLIASQSIQLGAELFSTDQDFSHIAQHTSLRLYKLRKRK